MHRLLTIDAAQPAGRRLARLILAVAMVGALVLLLHEDRGQTLFVDEWTFGFGARGGSSPADFLNPDNGHLAALPVLIGKLALRLFGADTALPLQLVAIGLHLALVSLLFIVLERAVGPLLALAPTVLFLFLGAASDVLIGSHAIPIELAAVCGLGAWLALAQRRPAWDAIAAALLVAGILANGLLLPFLVAALALLLLDSESPRRRLWVIALPLGIYLIWRLTYGTSDQSGFAIENVAGLPAFAFDSLAAALAALSGLFTASGASAMSFELGRGQALAGALLVAAVGAAALAGYRPPRAALPVFVALCAFWLLTGLVAGPARQPYSSRYLYVGVLLVILLAATLIAASPRRGPCAVALACVCAIGLVPNLRELHYGGEFFRAQSEQNRAALAAAGLLVGRGVDGMLVEDEAAPAPGTVADMTFPIGRYGVASEEFGTPALSLAELREASPAARGVADWTLARATPLALRPGSPVPGPCRRFAPPLRGGALTTALPRRGLWVAAAAGPPVAVSARRFGDEFSVEVGTVSGGRAAVLAPIAGPAGSHWQVRLKARQPLRVCPA